MVFFAGLSRLQTGLATEEKRDIERDFLKSINRYLAIVFPTSFIIYLYVLHIWDENSRVTFSGFQPKAAPKNPRF